LALGKVVKEKSISLFGLFVSDVEKKILTLTFGVKKVIKLINITDNEQSKLKSFSDLTHKY
jgi:hypothetical protein